MHINIVPTPESSLLVAGHCYISDVGPEFLTLMIGIILIGGKESAGWETLRRSIYFLINRYFVQKHLIS